MRKYIYIGAGGIIGAILRYLIKEIGAGGPSGGIPWGTLLINVLGCFLLALVLAVSLEVLELGPNLRLGITTGLLGAFTTFSTLCRETVALIDRGFYFTAVSYVTVSVALSFFAVYAGAALARRFLAAKVKDFRNKLPAGGGSDKSEGR